MAIENEFAELMPHRIRVRVKTGTNNYGRPIYADESKEFQCLVDEETRIVRNAQGQEVTVGLTAYVFSVPIGEEAPVAIEEDDEITILEPAGRNGRPLVSVSSHWWADGSLHNQELGFS